MNIFKHVAGIDFRICIHLQKSMMMLRLNIKYIVFVLNSIECVSKKVENTRACTKYDNNYDTCLYSVVHGSVICQLNSTIPD